MADYYSPTVVEPPLPLGAMTALELLVLEAVFEAEFDQERDHIYLFSDRGPSDMISLDRNELAAAIDKSSGTDASTASVFFAEKLRQAEGTANPADAYLNIDMTETSWEYILQDIVRRSTSLREIVVTTPFTCTKMRSDGFGGAVTLITANSISGKSTIDMLEDLRADAAADGNGDGAPAI